MMDGKDLNFDWRVNTADIFGEYAVSLDLDPKKKELKLNIDLK